MAESLYALFAGCVQRFPESAAVVESGVPTTYRELDARARRVAAGLAARGVGPETLVALCAERGVGQIAGMLGISAAGGAYLPLDPGYPDERIDYLVADSGVSVAVGSGPLADRLAHAGLAVVADDPEPTPDTDPSEPFQPVPGRATDLAYVIYTSGSTGAPKGVEVENGSVLRLFDSTAAWSGFGPGDVWTWFHSASFDFSVWEIWGALLHGGRLVVVPASATRFPAALLELLAAERVTVLNQTPSAFRQLLAAMEAGIPVPDLAALRLVVFGGERLEPGMLRPWLKRFGEERPRLVNMYGITETTVHVTHRPITAADLDRPGRSPIGVPLDGLRVTLHGPDGAAVPDGSPGEMWVAGPGVARGYRRRPELTAERFVAGPLGRAYRSGDLAVRLPSGELEVLGRVDDQIKVRGFRIEPFEVEAALAGHPAVAAAVAAARDFGGGDVRLVAYVQPARAADASGPGAEALADALRAHAAARLPAHLRPSTYELLRELPMTPNGKADRAALTRDGADNADGTDDFDHVDEGVARVAAAVLGRAVPPERDLFDLGATSLAFVRIVAEVNAEFGTGLTGAELGEVASVGRLAAAVKAALQTSAV